MTNDLPRPFAFGMVFASGENVDVYLRPDVPGVVLPPHLGKEPTVMLQFGLNMECPLSDMRIDDQSISATLRFGSDFFMCVVPWAAIWMLQCPPMDRAYLWPAAAPVGLAPRQLAAGDREIKRAHLRRVH